MHVHHALEALDAQGVHVQRYIRTPERYLAWIDAAFGGWFSSDVFAGSAYIAEDAAGPVGFAAFDVRGSSVLGTRAVALSDKGIGVLGSFGVLPRVRGRGLGRALLQGALFSLRERGYAHALFGGLKDEQIVAYVGKHANVREEASVSPAARTYRALVLASGNGTNFQAVIDAVAERRLPMELVKLVVNRADAYAVRRAELAGIPTTTIVWDRVRTSRAMFDEQIIDAAAEAKPDVVFLLGWMHVLAPEFLERFPKTINVHPAFLPLDVRADTVTMPDGEVIPAFRGARAVDDGIAAGMRWFGASVHRVGCEVDRGDILARVPLLREPGETRERLVERLHEKEHECVVAGIQRLLSPIGSFSGKSL